ncbi:MAG: aminoglycoside phosphotransferase family protein [Bacteroidia bacterium]|nr:aminoglycoside phosphotransferase family protein [Bacteroidia bacterium]
MDIKSLINCFQIKGEIKEALPFGSGHINETFRLINKDTCGKDYLLQKINHHIFKDVDGMMNNIHLVCQHLEEVFAKESDQESLEVILSIKGKPFVRDSEGCYWRMFDFKSELISYDIAETPEQIFEGARSFGIFMRSLADFPVEKLVDTIPDFHHVGFRIRNLRVAVEEDKVNRVKECKELIDYAFSVTESVSRIQKAGEQGLIPMRVTHNDTKFNNVLLTKRGKGRCVIDLDTVMPGYVHYDFGDGIRTTVCTAPEDEEDLEKIVLDMERFEAFAAGFLAETRESLGEKEIELLAVSGALFAYLMGIRFLTDYLEGDIYYKTHFAGQNLQRAKAQLYLCKRILAEEKELTEIIQKYI